MSVGHLCQHCGQGRVRPFQFSLEQAVVTCDNVDCDSRLEVSPWSCIVDRNLLPNPLPAPDQGRRQLWSRSSSSSSGFQSDVRSPLLSPARSCDSVTDREVEHLLRRYLTPRQRTVRKKSRSCTKHGEIKSSSNADSFDSFFELLKDLDLDTTDQSSKTKECLPVSQPSTDDTGFDPVTSELESWMKGFESPMPSIKKDATEKESEAQQDSLCGTEEATRSDAPSSQRLYIPSRGSAFSQVSPKKDCIKRSGSRSPVENADVSGVEKNQNDNAATAFERPFDAAKSDSSSICDAQFLSPAASAVSDDSGYEDSGLRLNSVLFLPSLLEKKIDPSCAIAIPEKNINARQNKPSSVLLNAVKNLGDTKAVVPSVPKFDILPTAMSSKLSVSPAAEESDRMDVQEPEDVAQESVDLNCSMEQEDDSVITNTSGTSRESSQPSDSTPPLETEGLVSAEKASDLESCSQSCVDKLHQTSECDQVPLSNEADSHKAKPKYIRTGRPRGRPKKEQQDPSEIVPKRGTKRRKKEEGIDEGNASLRRGLATLLQTPTLHIKKDKDGNRHRHHNLTTLSLRSRLHGNFIEDPWSVPELYLEELRIEIIVQGSRNARKSSNKNIVPSLDRTLQAGGSKDVNDEVKGETGSLDPSLEANSKGGAVDSGNTGEKEVNVKAQSCVGASNAKCIKSDSSGESCVLDLDSQSKDAGNVVSNDAGSNLNSDECSNSTDCSSETFTTKDETDVMTNLSASNSSSNSGVSSCVQRLDSLNISQELKISNGRPNFEAKNPESKLKEISINFRSEKQTLEELLDDRLFDMDDCDRRSSTNNLTNCGISIVEEDEIDVSTLDKTEEERESQEQKILDLSPINPVFSVKIDESNALVNDDTIENPTISAKVSEEKIVLPPQTSFCKSDDIVKSNHNLDFKVTDSIDLNEIPLVKENKLPLISLLDISFELNHQKIKDNPNTFSTQNASCVSKSPHELGSLFLSGSVNSREVRSWMGYPEGQSKESEKDESIIDASIDIPCDDKKVEKGPASDYFSSLLKDIDFGEEFFQCPTTENPSSTFSEHLSSSLFFGETAGLSVVSPASSVSNLSCNSSSSTSLPKQSSLSVTVPTISSSSSNSVSNTTSTIASSPSSSSLLSQAYVHTSCYDDVDNVDISSANESFCLSLLSHIPQVSPQAVERISPLSGGTLENISLKNDEKLESLSLKTNDSNTSVTQSLNKAITSAPRNIYLPSVESGTNPKVPFTCDSVIESLVKGVEVKEDPENLSKRQRNVEDPPRSPSESVKIEAKLVKNNECLMNNFGKPSHLDVKKELGTVKKEPGLLQESSCFKAHHCNANKQYADNIATNVPVCGTGDIPTISIDSDDEIQIIMPKAKSQSDKIKSNVVPVSTKHIKVEAKLERDVRTESPSSVKTSPRYISQPFGQQLQSPSEETCLKRKRTGHQEALVSKKLKKCNTFVEQQESASRLAASASKIDVDVGPLKESQCRELMCGIMDNSVVHDSNCFSPKAKGFIEFEENLRSNEPPEKIKFYIGSNKAHFKLCEDLKVSCESMPSNFQENVNDITLKPNLLSPEKSSVALSFNVCDKFGCTKSSPQHTSPKSEESGFEIPGLDTKKLSFLCYDSSSESCFSSPDDDDSEDERNDREVAAVIERRCKRNIFEQDISACESEAASTLASSMDMGTSLYDGSGEDSESDREIEPRVSKRPDAKVCTKINISNSRGNVLKFPVPQFRKPVVRKVSDMLESQSELDERESASESTSSCFVPAVPLTKKVAVSVHVPLASTSEKFTAVPSSLKPKPFASSIVKSDCRSQSLVLRKANLHKADATNGVGTSQEPEPLCLPKGERDQKQQLQPRLLQNAESFSQLHPPQHHLKSSSFHHLNQQPSSSSSSHTIFIRNPVAGQLSSSSTNVGQLHPHHSLLRDANPHSFIDYQMPSVANPNVIIPPALRSSYTPSQTALTHHSVPGQGHTPSFSRDLSSSNNVSNLEERIIAVKTETPNGPVMRLLRVNVVSNNQKETLPANRVAGLPAPQPKVIPVVKPKISFSNPIVRSPAQVNAGTDKPLESTECVKDNNIEGKDSNNPKELLTRIKIGSNGKFYIRPTSAIMKAISEMRKNQDQETITENSDTECTFELPDGIPISNPMTIPRDRLLKHMIITQKKERKIPKEHEKSEKPRKRRKKCRLEQIQNLVKEKLEETVVKNKDEVPEMVVVCIGGKLHVYSRDTDSVLAQ